MTLAQFILTVMVVGSVLVFAITARFILVILLIAICIAGFGLTLMKLRAIDKKLK